MFCELGVMNDDSKGVVYWHEVCESNDGGDVGNMWVVRHYTNRKRSLWIEPCICVFMNLLILRETMSFLKKFG